ncbi:hypothetical protein [uncultured Ruegeria sp.]|uniref:hypothetical protein n=1 Tax=uncultured Ruegeria sp. TaxID=259304 RepID=UPI00261C0A43|nr:hypothetical protein [uncultured Ruegeria sp.]
MNLCSTEEERIAAKVKFAEAVLHVWHKADGRFRTAATEAAGAIARKNSKNEQNAMLEFQIAADVLSRSAGDALRAQTEESKRQGQILREQREKEEAIRRQIRSA